MKRFMLYRKVFNTWVPLTEWKEASRSKTLPQVAMQGLTLEQIGAVIQLNSRNFPAAQYGVRPIEEFLEEELNLLCDEGDGE